MPLVAGLELAQKVRLVRNTPFILYTGKGSEELAAEAFEAGIAYYLRKEPNPRHYVRLAKRIRWIVERHRVPLDERKPMLPDSPRIDVRGHDLDVVEENGKETLWGPEENPVYVAELMELELKAINYVRNELVETVTRLADDLTHFEIPREDIPNIIYAGYRKLFRWFKSLDKSFNHR